MVIKFTKFFFKVRWLAWAIVLICNFIIWYTYNNLQSELAPMEDRELSEVQHDCT